MHNIVVPLLAGNQHRRDAAHMAVDHGRFGMVQKQSAYLRMAALSCNVLRETLGMGHE